MKTSPRAQQLTADAIPASPDEEAEINARVGLEEQWDRSQQRAAVRAFVEACAAGDVTAFLSAVDALNVVGGWRSAMKRVGTMESVPKSIQDAFLAVWIEMKMLPLRVGHRPSTAAGLRVLMPRRSRLRKPIRLYRGASATERARRLYGFSWTTNLDIAASFASHWKKSVAGGVILETLAPPVAVFLTRREPDHFDESEVIVDPYRLLSVSVVARLQSEATPAEIVAEKQLKQRLRAKGPTR